MEVEEKIISSEVYHIDTIGGQNGLYLWDLGIKKMVGNKSKPICNINNMHTFGAIVGNIDVNTLNDMEPNKKQDLTVFLGDYVVYCETSYDNASFIISEENEIYSIINRNIRNYSDDGDYIVLKKQGYNSIEKIMVSEEELQNNRWRYAINI